MVPICILPYVLRQLFVSFNCFLLLIQSPFTAAAEGPIDLPALAYVAT